MWKWKIWIWTINSASNFTFLFTPNCLIKFSYQVSNNKTFIWYVFSVI